MSSADDTLRHARVVDELLADRLQNCFCADDSTPCLACMEVARIRGAVAAKFEELGGCRHDA